MEPQQFLGDLHVEYIKNLFRKPVYIEHWMAEHLKMNALYWGIGALFLMHHNAEFEKEDVVSFILECYDTRSGGFGSAPRHDAHLLSTLSALQVLKLYDALDAVSAEKRSLTVQFIKGLQLPDGSFEGDRFGEVDTRFVYTAIQSLAILEELTPEIVDPAVNFILRCQNFDSSFGMVPGAESHSAQAFTCLGTLAICHALDKLQNVETLEWWLSDRQVANGGLNGRPEKLPDVCYSWWVLSCLGILDKLNYVDSEKLTHFILSSQNSESGGISDRAGNECDVYHTFFGLAGLSLLGKENLEPIDPIYGLPVNVTKTIKKYPYN
ncbi:DEKNAAC104722 [Brettanomyces naardenensis]|uniref:Geranylgeranyl transferase type-2 subunit beta n=1 Tax=Brettanomyces naardenensis TaxID=13370 RepID=A0A448YRF6_BRENA|nr:DEKNAAC104722 [Brettanomyces naardenensis]